MSYSAINTAIIGLTTGVTTLNGVNVEWLYQNIPFDEQRLTAPNYIRVLVESMTSIPASLTNQRGALYNRRGNITCDIRAAIHKGAHDGDAIVAGLQTLFERKAITVTGTNQLYTEGFTINDIGNVNFYVLNLVLPFNYWEVI